MILEEAIQFFADEGFQGQTRALASRLGITHSVLYRYFPSKEALIDRVYKELYLRRWNPNWKHGLSDRKVAFGTRLREFYLSYTEAIFDAHWVRIFIYSGLRDVGITQKYYNHVRKNIIVTLCAELRAAGNLPSFEVVPIHPLEEELFWSLHGSIFFLAVRKFIYGVQVRSPPDKVVDVILSQFLESATESVVAILESTSKVGIPTRRRVRN